MAMVNLGWLPYYIETLTMEFQHLLCDYVGAENVANKIHVVVYIEGEFKMVGDKKRLILRKKWMGWSR